MRSDDDRDEVSLRRQVHVSPFSAKLRRCPCQGRGAIMYEHVLCHVSFILFFSFFFSYLSIPADKQNDDLFFFVTFCCLCPTLRRYRWISEKCPLRYGICTFLNEDLYLNINNLIYLLCWWQRDLYKIYLQWRFSCLLSYL